MWAYNERFSAQLNKVNADTMAQLEALSKEKRDEVFHDAFDRVRKPHLLSGIYVPTSLIPEESPWLSGVSEEDVIAAFTHSPTITVPPNDQRWIIQAKKGRVDRAALTRLLQQDPQLANTVHLIAPTTAPSDLDKEQHLLCRQSPQCLRQVLHTRHIHHYNALVLLYRFANGHGFSDGTVQFARLNPGFYLAARSQANQMGFGPVPREAQAVLSIHQLQQSSVRSMRVTAIFFAVGLVGLTLMWFFRRRARELRGA